MKNVCSILLQITIVSFAIAPSTILYLMPNCLYFIANRTKERHGIDLTKSVVLLSGGSILLSFCVMQMARVVVHMVMPIMTLISTYVSTKTDSNAFSPIFSSHDHYGSTNRLISSFPIHARQYPSSDIQST